MVRPARRLALGLGAVNLGTLVLVAALSARDGFWGMGNQALPPDARPVSEIARTLEEQGYEHIYGIEVEHGKYLVKALDPEGRRIRLMLDPVTGTVVR